jgi:hypothetical protein
VLSSRKIIIRLIGGLGNQLFQAQYGLRLQNTIGGTIYFDDSFFLKSSKIHEKLFIGDLNLPISIITLSGKDIVFRRTIERVLYKLRVPFSKLLKPLFLFENQESSFECSSCIILDGFWQDSKNLYEPFIKLLREHLTQYNSAENLPRSNIICVHVRRGDYLTNRHWGVRQQIVSSLDYYLTAFEYFEGLIENPVFEIYTDDESWASKAFSARSNTRVIKSSGVTPLKLLSMMSNYNNFIIANSSLSWWAATLSTASQKIIILPKKWGKGLDSDKFTQDGWIQL